MLLNGRVRYEGMEGERIGGRVARKEGKEGDGQEEQKGKMSGGKTMRGKELKAGREMGEKFAKREKGAIGRRCVSHFL